jgi:hypothetical protein
MLLAWPLCKDDTQKKKKRLRMSAGSKKWADFSDPAEERFREFNLQVA